MLADHRTAITAALDAVGITAHTVVPERWAPPGVFVGPGDPYISREGMTFGGEIVRYAVTLVVASGTNEVRAAELDALILRALDALYGLEDFDVADVERPGQVSINGEAHLATSIDVTTQIHRE